MIKINNNSISSVYDETTVIGKIFKGTLKVYERWIDLIVSGVPPLTLLNCKGVDLINYKIYGNSVQNGTPTQDNPVEIESVGDKTNNLFDLSILLDGIAIRYYTIDNNKVTVTRANGMGWASITPFNLKPNTEYNLYLSNVATVDVRTPNKVILLNKTGTSMSFTTDDTGLACFKFFSTDNRYPYEIGYIHLVEKGTSVTGYEPYGKYKIPFKVNDTVTNIYLDEPLRKIDVYNRYSTQITDTFEDYIDFKNQKVVRYIDVYIPTGDENWSFSDGQLYALVSSLNTINNSYASCFSNYLIGKSRYWLYDKNQGISCTSNFIRIRDDLFTDVTVFKEWLDEKKNINPLKIYYILETPTEETIELPNIPTIKGTNILEVDTTIQPSNLEVVYKGK